MNVKAVRAPITDNPWDRRWFLVDEDTGEIVDDAQGYGYRSPQKAYASWSYKNRSPEKKARDASLRKAVHRFLAREEGVEDALENLSWDIARGDYGPRATLTGKMVDQLLEEMGYRNLSFTGRDLLRFR